jgi:hypothetical protein
VLGEYEDWPGKNQAWPTLSLTYNHVVKLFSDRNVLGTRFYTRLYFKKGAKLAFYFQKGK